MCIYVYHSAYLVQGRSQATTLSATSRVHCQAMDPTVPGSLQALIVFGLTLESALKLPEAAGATDVDVVELWCGVGSIVAAASTAGYVIRNFDKFRVPGVTDGLHQKTC